MKHYSRILVAVLVIALAITCVAGITAGADEYENILLGKPLTATTDYQAGFFAVSQLNDGVWTTYNGADLNTLGWSSNPFDPIEKDTEIIISADLQGVYNVDKFVLKPMQWSNGEGYPKAFSLEVSLDGETWTEVKKTEDNDVTASENTLVVPQEYTFDAIDAAYARIRITENSDIQDNTGAFLSQLGEWEIWGKKVSGTQPETQPATEPDSNALHGASFDTIYVNDVMNFGQADGAASDKLDGVGRKVDGSDGSVKTIRLRGWIGFESEIAELGYQINGKNTFGDFKVAPEAAVTDPANGGQYATRFDMTIDVSELKGTNKIVAVVKLADGTIVKIDENVNANGAGTTPNTSFTYVGPAEENVQTGDFSVAMFAVIAVLALGAAVVFAKKRAF